MTTFGLTTILAISKISKDAEYSILYFYNYRLRYD